jgi:hypothetical protein
MHPNLGRREYMFLGREKLQRRVPVNQVFKNTGNAYRNTEKYRPRFIK